MYDVEVVGAAGSETIRATPKHPFWVGERGWVEAENLLPGDELFSISGNWLRVAGVTETGDVVPVYNLEVAGMHTYFVGEHGAWTHNSCDPGLDKFVKRLEDNGVAVDNINVGINGPLGDLVGEVDVVTRTALIQYKDGASSAHAVIKQVLERTEPFVNRPVIAFINGKNKAAKRTVRRAGKHILVTNDFDLLLKILQSVGRACLRDFR